MVLCKERHHIRREVTHVFTDKEGDVAAWNRLIVDYSITDLILGPLGVNRVRQFVIHSGKDGNRDVFYLGQGDLV